ncbi:MAG TPA: Ig-like domain-containing protein [Bryobacteraceae bacterium]|jgi:hypothetical protein|nr:Ig-like domain-containing protein [Bryobacteraceae bacterium]
MDHHTGFRAILLILICFLLSCPDSKRTATLPFGGVNRPAGGQKLQGAVEVIGWALADSGIESVSLYVDRAFHAKASIGLPRADVAAAYPKATGGAESGWRATLDTTTFSSGWHELTVQAVSKAGTTRDLASLTFLRGQ